MFVSHRVQSFMITVDVAIVLYRTVPKHIYHHHHHHDHHHHHHRRRRRRRQFVRRSTCDSQI